MNLELNRNFEHRCNKRVPNQNGEPKVVSKELSTTMGNLEKKVSFADRSIAIFCKTTSWQLLMEQVNDWTVQTNGLEVELTSRVLVVLDHSAMVPPFLFPLIRPCGTVGQNNRLKYWATRSFVCLFARTAHSFACSALRALLARSAALTSITPLLVGQWMIRWLFILFFFFSFWPIVV